MPSNHSGLNHHPETEDQAEWDGVVVTVSRSEIDGSLYVVVDTSGAPNENIRIDLNDGTIWNADPDAEPACNHDTVAVDLDIWPPRCECGAAIDTWSSASRQHYINTGNYLAIGEANHA